MATVTAILARGDHRTSLNEVFTMHSWSGLGSGDDGLPISYVDYADRTVQVGGTFSGGTVIIEGSLDGLTYHTLTDPVGNDLSYTSADLSTVMEAVRYIRPRISGGDGSTSITVTMMTRREVV